MFCPNCGSQIPDGAMFCSICGEKLVKPEAPVSEPAPVAEAPVMETPVVETPVVEAPAEAPAAPEAPVQQPVYQQPAYQQPVYQQPVYQQPVYQQPAYQQPYQQPVAPAIKKKSKAPLIITIIVLVLLLAAGGLVVFESFFADKEDRPDFLGYFDFNKGDKSESAMSSSDEKEFKKILKEMDEAIINEDGKAYSKLVPSFAREYVWSVYGVETADEFVSYLHDYEFDENEGKKNKDEKMNGISHLGKNVKVTEEIVKAEEIKPKKLNEALDNLFDKKFDIDAAYLVLNNSCFEGKDGDVTFSDYYIFYMIPADEDDEDAEDEWFVILVGEDNLEDFGLKSFDSKKDDKDDKEDKEDEKSKKSKDDDEEEDD